MRCALFGLDDNRSPGTGLGSWEGPLHVGLLKYHVRPEKKVLMENSGGTMVRTSDETKAAS